jgi:hypothetical protein
MHSSDTTRALSQVRLLIEELDRFIEILRNAPPANALKKPEEAIEEAKILCSTLSTLENTIFKISSAAIRISQLRPLFIELLRYERCRKAIHSFIDTFQENITRGASRNLDPTLTTNILERLPTTLPEKHRLHPVTKVKEKKSPKSLRIQNIISVVKNLGRNQQEVTKDETTSVKDTKPNFVEEADKRQAVDQSGLSQKELAYTLWKIRGVSTFLNGILADWVR